MEADTPKKSPVMLIVGLLIAVGGFYLFMNSALDGGTYFLKVEEATAATLKPGRPIRVKGDVALGTYRHADGTTIHAFTIEGGGQSIPIYYDGPMPDVFAEGREVVVEGAIREDGTLIASEVTAKCPSKYEAGVSEDAKKQLGLEPPTKTQ